MIGGGLDISRLYLAKTRLQQACDAGVLVGRKAMGSGSWSTTKGYDAAKAMFQANFADAAYGSSAFTKSFSETGGTLTVNASVGMPMTIMRIFGQTERTIAVTCTAEMRIPNTDVMFVLDTTGSMSDRKSTRLISRH